MRNKFDCYVKLVAENFYCDMDKCTYPKIQLIFLSKRDYKKINEIEKMCEKYYTLERNEEDEEEKEKNLYHQLKKIIRYLNECEVMEVLSDHPDAFDKKFYYIWYIMEKSVDMRLQRSLIRFESGEDQDDDYTETFSESIIIPKKYETKRLKKKIIKAGNFLWDKIRYQ